MEVRAMDYEERFKAIQHSHRCRNEPYYTRFLAYQESFLRRRDLGIMESYMASDEYVMDCEPIPINNK